MAITKRAVPGNAVQVEIKCDECAHRDVVAKGAYESVAAMHGAEHGKGIASASTLRELARLFRRPAHA